jgi:hypothetical protein
VQYAIYVLPPKVDMASRRYFDASHLVSGSLGILHPYEVGRIRLLLSRVVVPENKSSDEIDLEY